MKKRFVILSMLLALTMCISNVLAITYGTVTVLTDPDKVDIVTDNNKTTITYKKPIDLEIAKEDESLDRPGGSGWIGLKVNAPEGSDKQSLTNAKYYAVVDNVETKKDVEVKNFMDKKDGEWYINIWSGISLDRIKQAEAKGLNSITRHWYFDWDGNDTFEQEILVITPLKNITLKDETGNVVYSPSTSNKKDDVAKTGVLFSGINFTKYIVK